MCLGQVQKHTVQDEISSLKGTLLLTAKGKKDAEPLQPSTTGLLVRCQYSVVISVQADGCTCCRQPEILQVPISIVAPPPLNYGVVDKPADWQPTKFATSEITFREQDMYKSQKDMQQQQQSLVYVPPQRYTLDVAAQQNQGYPNMYQQMGQPPHMNKNYQHLDSCVSETGTFYTQDTSAQKPTYNYPPLPDSQQQLK